MDQGVATARILAGGFGDAAAGVARGVRSPGRSFMFLDDGWHSSASGIADCCSSRPRLTGQWRLRDSSGSRGKKKFMTYPI